MIKMIKIILFFCLLNGCAPYLMQSNNYVKNSCLSECKYRTPEFDSIDSAFKKNNLFPDSAKFTIKEYSQKIISFFKNNQTAFVNHDTLFLSFNYQSYHRVACNEIWPIKDSLFKIQIIKSMNDSNL
jgi:hypothetical protein